MVMSMTMVVPGCRAVSNSTEEIMLLFLSNMVRGQVGSFKPQDCSSSHSDLGWAMLPLYRCQSLGQMRLAQLGGIKVHYELRMHPLFWNEMQDVP